MRPGCAITVAVVALAAASAGCGSSVAGHDDSYAKEIVLRASDLGSGWMNVNRHVHIRKQSCAKRAACAYSYLSYTNSFPIASSTAAVFATTTDAQRAYDRSVSALPPVGVKVPVDAAVAKLLAHSGDREAAKVTERSRFTVGAAHVSVITISVRISGSHDKGSFAEEYLYIGSGRAIVVATVPTPTIRRSDRAVAQRIAARMRNIR